ncbi:cytochrome P450 [Cryphonectria parasitica EP155]|uniref:Cytochrome P450 n=1 Tax=Cryphonectria parasitica (strain ATCC 38755 / EP155) TaxID=660469 RepID=A0A9P5CJY4_CRYP1|nr:cytochrome P450 [Cryphonectria parasitica EP155]KAF3760190.1 cytochrome P450 [Cryphonectria parasitica EP155]
MRTSRLPYCFHLLSGRLPFRVLELHKTYGSVVRIAPDELVFADARAWRDIMGHRAAGEPEMEKAKIFYRGRANAPTTLLNADRDDHGKLRRLLAHGFSERSMREQQPIIMRYVDLLIRRLHENSQGGTNKLDMVKWYNYTTFDVIGDLTFGEPFGCLENSDYHPWVSMIFAGIKFGAYGLTSRSLPWVQRLVMALVPRGLAKKREEHLKLTKEKLLKRMNMGASRPDLIEGLLRKHQDVGEKGKNDHHHDDNDDDDIVMDVHRLQLSCSGLIVAGSETTATLLSGVTYLLGRNPDKLARLTAEVRSAFQREDEIDFASASRLNYLLACLDEGLRIYSPTPLGLPRSVPKGGWTIAGHYVAEDTIVSQYHYALYHNEEFFTAPEEFHPERWLGDPRFATDNRDIFQPFHVGPRNCVGRNLAYVEMRVILARTLWNFDLKLAEDSQNWIREQKIYLLWEKQALNVYLVPRKFEQS